MPAEPCRIVAINPGSTSTKFAYFEDERALLVENLRHSPEELAPFKGRPVLDQLEFRLEGIAAALARHGVDRTRLSAIVGRGGLLKPLASGTYRVNQAMVADCREAQRGEHPSNLGALLALRLAGDSGAPAFIVDPVSVDEWPPIARLSGAAGLDRECLSHALNTKAVAKRFAREQGRKYPLLRLIVAHLGSGISVSAHLDGRMVDVTNSREEGAFSTERAGGVPVMKLVEMCFAGELNRKQVEARLFRESGVSSYLGTADLQQVLARVADGDAASALVFEAMLYQVAKEIGAMAAVLGGRVDAVLLTGGMVHAPEVVSGLKERIEWIAPVHAYPGEDELQALAEGALRVLRGEEQPREYT